MELVGSKFAPEACHAALLRSVKPDLAYSEDGDFPSWRQAVATKLREIIGPTPEIVPLDVRSEEQIDHAEFREIRLQFTSETGADVPCHLLTPLIGSPPYPLVICLQGHTSGMHISLGRPKSDTDVQMVKEGDRDFALQAVREGYAALVMEQRCFGERADSRSAELRHNRSGCHHASMVSMLLGRTMIGERVWDVSRAIDAIAAFPEIDSNRIGIMGNSGGGTISYFAACLEPRISIAMPSCYVCSFRWSITQIDHCADNYIPSFLRWFDLADIACLIAPRPLVVVAGATDPIFPLEGFHAAFDTIQQIYTRAGAPDSCRLVIVDGGHRFYADQSWPVFAEVSGWQR